MAATESLSARHPKRLDVLALLVLSTVLLGIGLSVPIITTTKLLIDKDTYTIVTGIISLFKDGSYVLGAIIVLFSVIFPITKLLTLYYIWLAGMTNDERDSALRWLKISGKWSMLDVMIVAVVVASFKLGGLADAEAEPGVYVFAAAILLSMIATLQVDRIARER